MIAGYNTDVQHDGIVYHVQTEDKGLGMPVIVSLVYAGGEVLAGKRSPYDDLVAAGFDERILAERLQHQHKLICAAVRAGRIEDLKRLSRREATGTSPPAPREEPAVAETTIPVEISPPRVTFARRLWQRILSAFSRPSPEGPAAEVPPRMEVHEPDLRLRVSLLEEHELRSGQFVTIRVRVSRGSRQQDPGVPDAVVVGKILGSTFQPISTFAVTDKNGVASILALLPRFKSGRALIVVRVDVDGETAELRRTIAPA